ncbi:MAG: hypothetical protein QNK37_13700 [Acidobacteriota bacterium]|nr:hypothetical protein [Acidobacteriota bacterium]
MTSRPTLRINEWTKVSPAGVGDGAVLRGLRLTAADRELLAELDKQSLRCTELRTGLKVSIRQHVGTVTLSGLRIVIMPKIPLDHLMAMIAYAFDLTQITVTETRTDYASGEEGLIDLLGLSLLRSVERIARGGLLPTYRRVTEDLATPRGRLDMRHIATHPRGAVLRCTYDHLTVDHPLNQVIAAGLRFASVMMQSPDLRLDLARAADRFFGDISRCPLDAETIRAAVRALDRRSSHYRTALSLIALIHQGARLGDHQESGEMPLSSFLLDMNKVFERFLERHFRESVPDYIEISAQDNRSDVFSYLENAGSWKQPTIRPDFVFRRRRRVIAVADAKYKNRFDHPPTTAELYQLTTYGLAYDMPDPREVLLIHPLRSGETDRAAKLLFSPSGDGRQVYIRLVGAPIDDILDGSAKHWLPLDPR